MNKILWIDRILINRDNLDNLKIQNNNHSKVHNSFRVLDRDNHRIHNNILRIRVKVLNNNLDRDSHIIKTLDNILRIRTTVLRIRTTALNNNNLDRTLNNILKTLTLNNNRFKIEINYLNSRMNRGNRRLHRE